MLSNNWFVIVLVILGINSIGCVSAVTRPSNFSNVEQAFANGDHLNPPANMPVDSRKRTTLPVNYEDAYRAVTVSLTQAMLNIEQENKSQGVVFAQKVEQTIPGFVPTINFNNQRAQERRYYYAIVLKETGPEKTEITVFAKAQGRCYFISSGFGVPTDRTNCEKYAAVHWATGTDSAQESISQFMVLVRNNLIAAGAM